ncbi:head morphogenesis protein [Paraburkholderia aspalathi]|nr:head morphogenesis protein [Paraburkholderia aspalathi]
MLKRLSPRERFDALIADFEPILRASFLASIADIKSNVQLRLVVERLERNDIAGAIEALHIDATAFRPLDKAILAAFEGGGIAAVSRLPQLRDPSGNVLVVRFDVRHLDAERWLTQHSSNLITAITTDIKEAARIALTAGMEAGRNPRSTALDVVGRINRATGRREGGILGLTSTQTGYVENARLELLSGDPASLRNYLTRNRRDRRFDRAVTAAIRGEKPLPADTVTRMLGQYENSLLKLRGDTIARTETISALNASNQEAFRQGLEKTEYTAQDVTRVWKTASDERVRHDHRAMSNVEVVGLDTPFTLPDGSQMLYPGDTSLGASASQTINCRCTQFLRLDFLKNID